MGLLGWLTGDNKPRDTRPPSKPKKPKPPKKPKRGGNGFSQTL